MPSSKSDVKARLLACCDELADVVNERAVEYGDDVIKNLEELKDAIRSHVFKVYLVGEFSCGKSSLLNRWLGRDLLLTGLTPKTAVSSELHFAGNERMVLQSLDPEIPDQDLQGITEPNMAIVQERANAGELANVVLYVDNPRLQECGDLCLVDLPGLSSANAAHELALNRFLQERQCVAVFCIPIADGGVQNTSLTFLRKMDSFGRLRRFEFLLTKADERTAGDQEKIRARVKADLANCGIGDVFVGKVSRESTEDFEHLIAAFRQKQDTFLLRWFGDKLRTIADGVIDSLRMALSVRYDSSRIDDALARIEETERDELPALVAEINEDMRRSVQVEVSNVLASVHETVQSQKATLMAHAQNGGNCMDEVASLIRSTLASKASVAVQSVMNDAGGKAGDVLDERLDFDFEADVVPSQDVEVVPAERQMAFPSADDLIIAPLRKSKNPLAKGFCVGWQIAEVGVGLASIFAPGAGFLTTTMLGGLGMFLTGGFKTEEERGKQEADFEMNLSQACEAARPAISASIEKAINQCGQKLQAAVESKVKSLHAQIERLKAESASEKADWEARQSTRQKAKARIMNILAKLED